MFNFLPRVIQIGPVNLQLYGITLVCGAMVGCIIATRFAKERALDPIYIWDFTLYALIGGITAARLVFALQNLSLFLASPLAIFALQEGGLSFHGGLLGGFTAGIWYAKKKRLYFWNLADIIIPGLAIGEAVGRIGCDLYGKATVNGLFPIVVNGARYHNVPLYTGVSSFIIFITLWKLRKIVQTGVLFPLYILLYSIARFFIEFTRQSAMIGLLSVAQIASIVLVLLSGTVLWFLKQKKKVLTY
ncbi:MAG: prolipoprotein diacylglyceryl transferase [Bacillota bacterium]